MSDRSLPPLGSLLFDAVEGLGIGLALFDEDWHLLWSNDGFRACIEPLGLPKLVDQLSSARSGDLLVGDRCFDVRTSEHPTLAGATVCQVHDVTERVQAKNQLRMSVGILEALIHASPSAILMLDVEKRVTLWNPAAERIFGWTFEELEGERYPLVPEDGWAEFELFFDMVIQGKGFSSVEARRRRKDGETVDIEIATAPIRDLAGSVVGAMAILADRTEHNRLDKRFRESQKMEAVGRLAGGIAHDFNNVLTVILNTCEISRMKCPKSPLIVDIATIERAGERAADLTRQLLAFSRRQLLMREVLDLNQVVLSSVEMLRTVIDEDVILHTVLGEELCSIYADPVQLERVVMNLARNARDAMPDGGTLSFTTRELPAGHTHGEGVWVELTVADTGAGIEPDALQHIFEPFYTTKEVGTGSGLGLASVYGLVQQSGGDVTVESLPGAGAVFRVALPGIEEPKPLNTTGRGSMADNRTIRTPDGAVLSVRVDGDIARGGCLFVHGWMASGAVFAPLLEQLSFEGMRVVPDGRGTGRSTTPSGGYTLEQLAEDMWQVADSVGLVRPVIVGHSMGGQIAQYMAMSRPDDVEKLVLICPVPASGLPLPDPVLDLCSSAAGNQEKLGAILDMACVNLSPDDRSALIGDALGIEEACLVGTLRSWVAGGFQDRLGAISAETIVVATDDPFLPPALLQEQVVDPISNAHMDVLTGSGHYPQREDPVELARRLDALLKP